MPKAKVKAPVKAATPAKKSNKSNLWDLREVTLAKGILEPLVHVIKEKKDAPHIVCDTEERGFSSPKNQNELELVLHAPEGVIRLWASDTTLNWRFKEPSLAVFQNPAAIKTEIRSLLGQALLLWGDAVPVQFREDTNSWDFEIEVSAVNKCNAVGCVLASAFFPDSGRHELKIYPSMFAQTTEEQIETIAHELGHVFGLRHFFAQIEETALPSVTYGTHKQFTIMNYGGDSELTDTDKSDLKNLYQLARTGQLTHINKTPIQLVRPYTAVMAQNYNLPLGQVLPFTSMPTQPIAAYTIKIQPGLS